MTKPMPIGWSPTLTLRKSGLGLPQLLDSGAESVGPNNAYNGGYFEGAGLLGGDWAGDVGAGGVADTSTFQSTTLVHQDIASGTISAGDGTSLGAFNADAMTKASDRLVKHPTFSSTIADQGNARGTRPDLTDAVGHDPEGPTKIAGLASERSDGPFSIRTSQYDQLGGTGADPNLQNLAADTKPTLTGWSPTLALRASQLGTPQILDADVQFVDSDSDYNGGYLEVTGLLAGDLIGIAGEGRTTGISISQSTLLVYKGVAVGTISGGDGRPFRVTFNEAATAEAIDRLIERLTFSSTSADYGATRDLRLNVTDSAGQNLDGPTTFATSRLAGAADPFSSVENVGLEVAPAFLQDPGRPLALLIGNSRGDIYVYHQTTSGQFEFTTQLASNSAFGAGSGNATPTFADLNGDGKADYIVGASDGTLKNLLGRGAGDFATGDRYFDGIDVGSYSSSAFIDLNGDGRLDLLVGSQQGAISGYVNNGPGLAFSSVQITGFDQGTNASPHLAVTFLNGKPALVVATSDMVNSRRHPVMRVFEIGEAFSLVEKSGLDNPFSSLSIHELDAPAFVDINLDGLSDLVLGEYFGDLVTYLNTTVQGQTMRLSVVNPAAAVDETLAAVEDTPITYAASALLGNDGYGDPLTIASVGNASGGTVLLNQDGTVAFTPTANFNGAAGFDYVVSNGQGDTDTGHATVNVTAVNDAPVLTVGGTASYIENAAPTAILAGLVFSDDNASFDQGGMTLEFDFGSARPGDMLAFASSAANGITIADGTVRYGQLVVGTISTDHLQVRFNGEITADAIQALARSAVFWSTSDNPGSTSRTVKLFVNDHGGTANGGLDSAVLTRTVSVTPVNDAPSVTGTRAGLASGTEDGVYTVTSAQLLQGVTDVEGSPLSVTSLAADHGTVTGSAASGWTITPEANFNGPMTLSYSVSDGVAATALALSYTVAAVNDAPVNVVPGAQPAFDEDGSRVLGTANGNALSVSDLDADPATEALQVTLSVAHGTLTLASLTGLSFSTGDGSSDPTLVFTGTANAINAALGAGLTYTPTLDYYGADMLTISTSDLGLSGTGGEQTDTDTVALTITAVADIGGDGNLIIPEDFPGERAIGLVTQFENPDRTITAVSAAAHGTVTVTSTGHGVIYRETADFNGTDSFTYTVTSGGVTETGTIIVTVSARADIVADSVTVNEDGGANTLNLLLNDSFENAGRAISAVGPASNGIVAIVDGPDADGVNDYVTYTPGANFTGSDSFTYTVTSGGVTETATVSVTVTAVNDAPAVTATRAVLASGTEDVPYNITSAQLLQGVTDADGDELAVVGLTADHGSVTGDAASGWTITPAADFNGAMTLSYTVSDGIAATPLTISYALAPVNDAPVLDLNGPGAGTGTNNGLFEQDPSGTGGIAPAATVTDADSANFDTGTLTVGITANCQAGDLLQLTDYTDGLGNNVSVSGNQVSYNGIVVGTFTNGDDDTALVITFNASATPAAAQFVTRAVDMIHTSDAPSAATRTLTFTLTDSDGGSSSALATIGITPENDAPVLVDPTHASVGFTENAQATALFAGTTVSDPDLPASFAGGGLTITIDGTGGGLVFLPGSRFSATGIDPFDLLDSVTGQVIGKISGIGTQALTVSDLDADATDAVVDALLQSFGFIIVGDDPTAGSHTATLTFNDGNNVGSIFSTALTDSVTQTVVVTAVDDPLVAQDDSATTDEATPVTIAVLANDGDPDGGAATTITAIGGQPIAPNGFVRLASGALVRLSFDGLISYNPNHAFDNLPPASSGASNSLATEVFSYTLSNGDTADVTVTIVGLAGGDNLLLGTEASDTLTAGPGNDSLYGLGDDDVLFGQSGNDILNGGNGEDNLDGGTGRDLLDGGADRDYLRGGGGTDDLLGGTSDDLLFGDGGNDRLEGGDGDDYLDGGDDNDLLDGGVGRDYLKGGSGADGLTGREGDDLLFGEAGEDDLGGGDGDDYLDGGDERDVLRGDAGADYLLGGAGNDTLLGGVERDSLFGEAGEDELRGEDGDDYLDGGAGRGYLYGGSGADALVGGLDGDVLFGESGEDNLSGGEGEDYLDGGSERDVLSGGGGRDYLKGGEGNDTLLGGADADFLFGEAGEDELRGDDGDDYLDGGNGRGYLYGGSGADALVGGGDNDVLFGEAGADLLNGGEGDDYLDGGSESDVLVGAGGADYLLGGAGDDGLLGGADRDFLFGQDGADQLRGEAGDDYLDGGAGTDLLIGGAGADTLLGGEGADRFLFVATSDSGPSARDSIADFDRTAGDLIDLALIDANVGTQANDAFSFIGTAAFSNTAGQLRYEVVNGVTSVFADTNGDGVADMSFTVNLPDLQSADFVL